MPLLDAKKTGSGIEEMSVYGIVKAGCVLGGTATFAKGAVPRRFFFVNELTAGSVLLGHIAAQELSCLFLGM